MSDWLDRLRGMVRQHDRAPDTEQSRAVAAVLGERVVHASEPAWLDAVAATLGDAPVDPRSLEHLVVTLRAPGYYGDLADEEVAAHRAFWARLAARHPGDAAVAAHHADVELTLGDAGEAMHLFLAAFDRQPELFFEMGWDLEDPAREAGGDLLFRWQLHLLRALIDSAADQGDEGDWPREVYSELLDEHQGEPDRLAALQRLGEELRRLEADGELPRAMVVRRRRRRDEG
ncbi:MAG: hypothetical protein H6709_04610 [Kofleriaceae bacterium]|nr:hypothetical protein [Kofleriaceae bacterium]MCB9571351.1 hypothetical protein [Kofleriaceae bacterium]